MDRKEIKVEPEESLMDIGQANISQPVPSTSSSEKCDFKPEDVHKMFSAGVAMQTYTESSPGSSFPSTFGISSANASVQNPMLSAPPAYEAYHNILPRKQYSKPQTFHRRLTGCKSRTASRPGSGYPSAFGISFLNTSVQNSTSYMPFSSHNVPRNQPPQTAGVGANSEPHHRVMLRELLQTLRLPSSPQQQDKILEILKTNPQLMAAFIKQRQQQRLQQRQQQVNYSPPILNRENAMHMNVGGPAPENGSNQQNKSEPFQLQSHTASGPGSSFPSTFGISSHTSMQNSTLYMPFSSHNVPRNQPPQTAGVGANPEPHHRVALRQLLQTLRLPSSPQQQDQILNILKTNPRLMAAFIKQRQQQQQQQQVNNLPPAPENGSNQQNSSHNLPRNQPPQTAGVGANRLPHTRQALQQLLQTLRLPSSPQQQDQILTIMKTNPQLMTAFIKQRQEQLQQQQVNNLLPAPENHSNQQNKFEPFQLESHTASSPGSSPPATFGIASLSCSVQNSILSGPSSYNPPVEQPPAPYAQGTGMNFRSIHRETLQRLLQVLRLPSSQQQKKEQIIAILKSSPQVMAALLKYRQQQQVNLPPNGEQAMYMNIGGPTMGNGSDQQSIIAPDVPAVRDPTGLSNQQDVQSESSMVESILQSIENLKISDIPLPNDMTTANSDSNTSLETNAQQNVTKQWYAEISPELRELLMKKTIESIISPGSDGTPRLEQNMYDFESYVRKRECDIYEAANSKFEYYDLLSKMSNEIRKELVEKNQ